MSVKVKASKKISPKDKTKIKTTITDTVSARTESNKLAYASRKKNVSNNKKHK